MTTINLQYVPRLLLAGAVASAILKVRGAVWGGLEEFPADQLVRLKGAGQTDHRVH